MHGGEVYRITQVLDFDSVVAAHAQTGRSAVLRVGELRPLASQDTVANSDDLAEIADADWKVAEQRFVAINPLLSLISPGRQDVEARAKQVGVDTATLYRWLRKYRAVDAVSALVPRKRGWKEGRGRISPLAEGVVQEVIENYYLKAQRPTAQNAVTEVERLCLQRHISAPSPSAIRARLARVSERDLLRGRGFKEKAKNKFQPVPGSFPNADYPLAVVQIDHTRLDVIVVDDVHRKPIDRPWLTLAVDVCTRVVVGYYLSFDAPSETSVAMCVAQAMLPKDEWLLLHKVDAPWPVWGRPRTIHVDNGSDFRANTFRQSCTLYGINLEYRPVKAPRYGGHIERLQGTLLREIHALPGTTFSSIKQREGYDSDRHAAITKSELEEWLVTLICKVYHHRVHSAIGMPPLKRWEIGIFGNAQIQGIGVPPLPADRLTVLLDFLPAFPRTVQPVGITIDGLTYYAEALRPWIGATDPDEHSEKRKFVFRRDPRDISSVWFFDPTLKHYFKVPLADQSTPAMSIWEYRQAKELARRQGASTVNKHEILHAITELRRKVDDAQARTKTARKQAARRADHARGVSPARPVPAAPAASPPPAVSTFVLLDDIVDTDIDADGDIA
jgi:putative transposase